MSGGVSGAAAGAEPRRKSLAAPTKRQKPAQRHAATAFSHWCGEKMRIKPRPFTSAEKLETQKGMRKRRKVVQLHSRAAGCQVLSNRATPTMTEMPSEVSHSLRLGSKYHRPKKRYQMR